MAFTWLKKYRLFLACALLLSAVLGVNWLRGAIPRRGELSRCTDQLQPGFTVWMQQEQYPMQTDRHIFLVHNEGATVGHITNPIWLEVFHNGQWYEMQRIHSEMIPATPYIGFSSGTTQYSKNPRTYGVFLFPGRYRYVLEFHLKAYDNTNLRYAFAEFEVV